jgi:hypothetical protein
VIARETEIADETTLRGTHATTMIAATTVIRDSQYRTMIWIGLPRATHGMVTMSAIRIGAGTGIGIEMTTVIATLKNGCAFEVARLNDRNDEILSGRDIMIPIVETHPRGSGTTIGQQLKREAETEECQ